MFYTYLLLIFFIFSFITKCSYIIIDINDKLNLCKKKIKEFIVKTNFEKFHIKKLILKIQDILMNNNDKYLINLILMKFPSGNNNYRINNENPNIITINYYDYSLIFTNNIINSFYNIKDLYTIYHENSSYISYENFENENDNNLISNPNILYKINNFNNIYNFIENYNYKNSKYIYIKLILYNININKLYKSYKIIKTTYFIKKNILDTSNNFLNLFKNLNNRSYYFINENKKLIFTNTNDQKFIIYYYYENDKSLIDNPLEYTYMTIREYNNFYI